MNLTNPLLVAGLILGWPLTAVGATLTIVPATHSAPSGTTAAVDLVISGLGAGTAPSLAAFDVDVTFDPAVLSFVSAAFGVQLDILGLGSIQAATPGVGTVNLFELSLDSPEDLNNLQDSSFVLASLTFGALSPGTSPLILHVNALGDAFGDGIPVSVNNGLVEIVSQAGDPVPEPGYFPPVTLLLAWLAGRHEDLRRRALRRSRAAAHH